jgi:hydrogenase nickel incorporation protein HypA/HybF
MHELSLVMGIVDLAREEAGKHDSCLIEEIVMDIGELSGVEMLSFDFAWNQAVKGTLLENTERKINRIPGSGNCLDCGTVFPMQQFFDPCPACGEHLVEVISGKEMRVKTLILRIKELAE